jgi:hypothetical protein
MTKDQHHETHLVVCVWAFICLSVVAHSVAVQSTATADTPWTAEVKGKAGDKQPGPGKVSMVPSPGEQKKPVSVTLKAEDGAMIRYTLDGTTPTRTNGYLYCGLASVRPGMTLKALAFKSGMADSPVTEAVFAKK